MATESYSFADARKNMVDSQVHPNRVTDPRILAAMRALPRERFVPANVAQLAYSDEDVPLGNGRYLMEPMVLAKLLQAANLNEGERALVVAAGTGYSAAVLAACGCRVIATEDDAALLAIAQGILPAEAPNVTLINAAPAAGQPAQGPYDLILIDGSVPEIPGSLAKQVKQTGGRIMATIDYGRVTTAVRAERGAEGLTVTKLFDCGTPALPSLRKAPAFAF